MSRLGPHRPPGSATLFAGSLDPGERVVWSGRPRQGLVLRASDIVAIPFSLLWGGFAIVWEAIALRSTFGSGPRPPGPIAWLFPLWGVPFVLIGLNLMIGRFFVDAYRRRQTQYAVTDCRALIVTRGRTTRFDLRTIGQVDVQRHADGTGTVRFGPPNPFAANAAVTPWGNAGGNAFDHVADVDAAYGAIRQAQRPTI